MRTVARQRTRNCNEPWCGSHGGNCRKGPHAVAFDVTPSPGQVLGWAVVVQDPGEEARAYALRHEGAGYWAAPGPLPEPSGPWAMAVEWASQFRDTLNRKLNGV